MTKWRVLRGAAYIGMIAAVVFCSPRYTMAAGAGSIDLCVTMSGGEEAVGGLQLDLTWDGACMTGVHAEGTAAQCASNPATRKNVSTAFPPGTQNLMRAIFFSISDLRPIPDGQLFCCSFTPAAAQANPCCSVNIGNLILSPPGGGGRLYASQLPDISIEAQVNGISCAAAVPGGSPSNPVRPPAPAAIAQPPLVSEPAAPAAPAAPAPGGAAPVMPRPNVPAQAPPVQGLAAEAPTAELAPTESVPSPAVTPAAVTTPTVARTPAKTPTQPTAAASTGTPQIHGTPTGPVPSIAAPVATGTRPARTPTPKRKHKGHKKRRHATPGG
jgi:hypothetical protein